METICRTYAEVNGSGVISRIFINWVAEQAPSIESGMTLIDITSKKPRPGVGDTVVIRQFVAVIDGQVVNIFNWSEDQAPASNTVITMLDISDMETKPSVGWTYADGIFTAPPEPAQPEE
jgi:hypothetical protein